MANDGPITVAKGEAASLRPHIERVSGKLAQLERMAEFRQQRLDRQEYGRDGGHFMRAELSALDAACKALRWHRAEVEGLDTPLLALSSIVDALTEGGDGAIDPVAFPDLRAALARARDVLEEWESKS